MKKHFNINIPMLVLGLILTSAAISLLTLPNKIVGGGVSGLSTLIYHTLGIEAGLSNAVINILLLLVGFKVLDNPFIIATALSSLALSAFVEIFGFFPPITTDPLLASIFGGVLYGAGVGLALAAGGSTGGTDIIGRILQCRFSHLPIGILIMLTDGAIILLSLIFFGNMNLVLYGVITLSVSTFTVDGIIRHLNVSKLAFVVTGKGDEVSKALISSSGRGVTVVNAVGAYTGEENKMLICALKNRELPKFQQTVLKTDPCAFIIFSESTQIVGNGFHVYR